MSVGDKSNESHGSLYDRYLLRKGEIRVLILHPCSEIEGPIVCSLLPISLSPRTTEYEALSYTWGPPHTRYDVPDQDILLCGQTVTIKGNLFDALCEFRQRDSVRYLWVDALSINQNDHVERSQQVSIMAQIYQKAETVLVWLGRDEHLMVGMGAISFLQTVAKYRADFEELSQDAGRMSLREKGADPRNAASVDERLAELLLREGSPFAQSLPADLEHSSVSLETWFTDRTRNFPKSFPNPEEAFLDAGGTIRDRLTIFIWQSLFEFAARPYFERRWVLQELFHAQVATAYCGSYSIDWSEVRSLLPLVVDFCYRIGIPAGFVRRLEPPAFRNSTFESLESATRFDTAAAALYRRLKGFCYALCQDERDIVYALLGFEDAPCLHPDYSLTPRQIWVKLYEALIQDGHIARLLNSAAHQVDGGRTEREKGLPSWLFDFSHPIMGDYFDLDSGTIGNEEDGDRDARVVGENQLCCQLRYLGDVVIVNG